MQIHVRTASHLDKVSEYVAHGALRQMAMMVFVVYIITFDFVEMHYKFAPICIVMFLIIVFPKLATCSWANWKPMFIETFSSIIQFTPEAVVGTIRVMRALKSHVTGNAWWVPQKAVEDDFKLSNPSSLRHHLRFCCRLPRARRRLYVHLARHALHPASLRGSHRAVHGRKVSSRSVISDVLVYFDLVMHGEKVGLGFIMVIACQWRVL